MTQDGDSREFGNESHLCVYSLVACIWVFFGVYMGLFWCINVSFMKQDGDYDEFGNKSHLCVKSFFVCI